MVDFRNQKESAPAPLFWFISCKIYAYSKVYEFGVTFRNRLDTIDFDKDSLKGYRLDAALSVALLFFGLNMIFFNYN